MSCQTSKILVCFQMFWFLTTLENFAWLNHVLKLFDCFFGGAEPPVSPPWLFYNQCFHK